MILFSPGSAVLHSEVSQARLRHPARGRPCRAAVLLPEGQVIKHGMTFGGTTSGGGTIINRIGGGYSPLDGFGFLNAEAAVKAPVH